MKEIVINCDDFTYEALKSRLPETSTAYKNACKFHVWLEDLVEAAHKGVKRNEILKHNKSVGHLLEKEWLRSDCEYYGTTVTAHLNTLPHGHPHTKMMVETELPGISKDDPEYEYYKETLTGERI